MTLSHKTEERDESSEAYARRLKGYTLSELEDVFSHLDRAAHPERFERVRIELEERVGGMATAASGHSASGDRAAFLRRWWGSLLDLFVQLFIIAVLYLVFRLGEAVLAGFNTELSPPVPAGEALPSPILAFVPRLLSGDMEAWVNWSLWGQAALILLAFILYRALLTVPSWSRSGQTPGMREVGVRLVSTRGGSLTSQQALGRFLAQHILFPLTLGVSGLWILLDRDGRALHDRVAGTRVIREQRTWEKPPEQRLYDD
jgi:uncharacterized RDD family membrane protein YckC